MPPLAGLLDFIDMLDGGFVAGQPSCRRLLWPMMAVSWLLKSWTIRLRASRRPPSSRLGGDALRSAQGLMGQFAFRDVVYRQQNRPEMINVTASVVGSCVQAGKIPLISNPGTSCRPAADRRANGAGRESPNSLRQRVDDLPLGLPH